MNKSNQSSESVKNPKLVAALQEVLKHDDFITRSQMAAALMEARQVGGQAVLGRQFT